jgi:outer membrane protein assembly factor BamB
MKPIFKIILLFIVVGISFGILIAVMKYSPAISGKDTLEQDSTHTPSSAPAASWPMFHGDPSLRGVASGALSDSFKLLWKFRTDGSITSSAAVEGGRVYVGSGDGKIYCLNLADGQEIWSFETEDAIEGSPCVLNGSVFVGSSDSFLYALDAETGDLKWKYEAGAKILGAANWTLSPEQDRAWILIGSYDNNLHCVDSITGKAVWTYETESYINGAPAIAGGKAVFGGCDEITHVVSVVKGDEVAEIETGSYIAGSPALVGNYAYVGNYGGEFIAIDIAAGSILWSYGDGESPFFASPAVGETQVVFGGRDKRLHCVNRDSGKLLWTFEARDNVDSSPVICDGKVIAGSDDGRLYVVRLSDGERLWSYEIGEAITASPAVISGMIIIGSEDGYVYAFVGDR